MGLGYTFDQILDKLKEITPEWIGISLNSLRMDMTISFIKNIKKNLLTTKIVVGGPHVTTNGIKVFDEIPELDYAIIGEGEESLYDLITNVPESEIRGLIYKDGEGKIRSNERRITDDINIIPFPKFTHFELDKYVKKVIPIVTSRGCPFKCIFCQQSSLLSKHWRGVSAEYFIEAVKYWLSRGYNTLHIVDDNFLYKPSRLEKIVELYEKEKLQDLKIVFMTGLRVNSMTIKNLTLLKKLGVDYISLGVESFDDEVLRFMKKGTTKEKIIEATKNVYQMGLKLRLHFIMGFPYQTTKTLHDTYKFLLTFPIYRVRFHNLIPYPNTLLMEWLEENGELLYPPSEYMNYFSKYQEIPIFKAKNTLTIEERAEQLHYAKQVARIVEERAKFLYDEI